MANLILSSAEAQTLYNTGRLIRTVDCEGRQGLTPVSVEQCKDHWVVRVEPDGEDRWFVVTPPLEAGAVYDVRIVSPPNLNIPVSVNRPAGFQTTPTYKLIVEEGKLRWYEELKRV